MDAGTALLYALGKRFLARVGIAGASRGTDLTAEPIQLFTLLNLARQLCI
jgi:hypothetical protein